MSKPFYLLGIFTTAGELCNPDELPGESAEAMYETPKAAKVAGRSVVERHDNALGFQVAYVFDGGHYRTVHTEARPEPVSPSTVEG